MVKLKDFIEILNEGIFIYINEPNKDGTNTTIYKGWNKIGDDEELTAELLNRYVKVVETKSFLTILHEPSCSIHIYLEN